MRKQNSRNSLFSNSTSNGNSSSSGSNVTRIDATKRDTSSKMIRGRYLNKLGFEQTLNNTTTIIPSPLAPPLCSSNIDTSKMILNRSSYSYKSHINDKSQGRRMSTDEYQNKKPIIEDQTLNNSPKCVGNLSMYANRSTSEGDSSIKKGRRSVSFDETVHVLTIPNKDAYSDRIRKFLWTNPHEMIQNATRNSIEFAHENWNWREVADDVEFYVCPVTGEKIHPCHTSYSSQQYGHYNRSLNRNPFFEKSKQAAIAWQQQHSSPYSNTMCA